MLAALLAIRRSRGYAIASVLLQGYALILFRFSYASISRRERSNFDGCYSFGLAIPQNIPNRAKRLTFTVARRLLSSLKQAAMKKQEINPNFDQNWAWPKNTWFRERLNALRARDEQAHRRSTTTRRDFATIEAKPTSDRQGEES